MVSRVNIERSYRQTSRFERVDLGCRRQWSELCFLGFPLSSDLGNASLLHSSAVRDSEINPINRFDHFSHKSAINPLKQFSHMGKGLDVLGNSFVA